MASAKRLPFITVASREARLITRAVSLRVITNIAVPLSFLLALIAAPLHAAEADAAVAAKPGQVLYENACVVCHQPMKAGQKHGGGHGAGKGGKGGKGGKAHDAEKGHANRLAPPMMMVKKHYLEAYPDKDVFVQKVAGWVAAPDSNAAKLSHAVERFGLMPPQAINLASRVQIAEYIFEAIPLSHGGKHGSGKHGGSKCGGSKCGGGKCGDSEHDGKSNCHGDKEKGHGGETR